jgi:hypothetical protein
MLQRLHDAWGAQPQLQTAAAEGGNELQLSEQQQAAAAMLDCRSCWQQ